MNLAEFFHMGGYAQFVWPVYGIALVVLVANVVAPYRRERRILRDIARKHRRESRGSQ